jgi:hypothetical protein
MNTLAATINLDNGFGAFVLYLYMVGGAAMFITSMLPGNSTGWKIFGAVGGLGIFVWALYVKLFGGTILISVYIAFLPFILAFRAIAAVVKARKEDAAAPPAPTFAQAPPVPPPYPPQGQYPPPQYAPPPGQYPPPPQGQYPPPQYAPPPGQYPPPPPQGQYPPPQYPQGQ